MPDNTLMRLIDAAVVLVLVVVLALVVSKQRQKADHRGRPPRPGRASGRRGQPHRR